jgi:hypothetical protein
MRYVVCPGCSSNVFFPDRHREKERCPECGQDVSEEGAAFFGEERWLACTAPRPMLAYLQASGLHSERKARLFAVA